MKRTSIDLFRAGNSGSARLDQLRAGEVAITSRNGSDWVDARSGGASTLDSPAGLRGKRLWRLPAQSEYDETRLYLLNDFGNHWSWAPDVYMPLADYLDSLG